MEQKSSPETDDYRYFDPKMVKQNENAQQKKTFQEVTGFILLLHIFLLNIFLICKIESCFARVSLL